MKEKKKHDGNVNYILTDWVNGSYIGIGIPRYCRHNNQQISRSQKWQPFERKKPHLIFLIFYFIIVDAVPCAWHCFFFAFVLLLWSDGRCWHELDLFEMNFGFKMNILHDARLHYALFYLNLPIRYKVGVCVAKGRITTIILDKTNVQYSETKCNKIFTTIVRLTNMFNRFFFSVDRRKKIIECICCTYWIENLNKFACTVKCQNQERFSL